jgi:hypothetical protein
MPSISGASCLELEDTGGLMDSRDRRKLTFYFIAEKRIDFRELVRELFRCVFFRRVNVCTYVYASTCLLCMCLLTHLLMIYLQVV